jgi:hypothetical protein
MPRVLNIRECPGFSQHAPIIPPGAVYVGRAMLRYRLRGSRWHNPFRDGPRAEVIAKYREWICDDPDTVAVITSDLCGRDLVCWCAPLPCHGDVLLELANATPAD